MRTQKKSLGGVFLLLWSIALHAGPVGLWHTGDLDGLIVPNRVGDYADLVASSEPELVDGIGGEAIYFPGTPFYLSTERSFPEIEMDRAMTVDVWLQVDDDATEAVTRAIVDKGGERYRLQLGAAGNPGFGLKSRERRGDIADTTPLDSGWVRLTGVFDRPLMRLFVNGIEVARAEWDQEMDTGRSLFLGAKSGVTDFFVGKIDTVALYDYPREPEAADYEQLLQRYPARKASLPVGASGVFSVRDDEGKITVSGEEWSAVFNQQTLEQVTVKGKQLLTDNGQPLLSGRILSAEHGAQIRVFSDLELTEWNDAADGVEVVWKGALRDEQRQVDLPLQVVARCAEDFSRMHLSVEPGDWSGIGEEWQFEHLSIQLPLGLDPRKRVAQGGAEGVHWDTRYFYQYVVSMGHRLMMPPEATFEPEVNIWRYFAVDQLSQNHFTLWRQESESTSAHVMQHGRQADGWMSIYNPDGGVFYAVEDFADLAPISLYADADGQGLLGVHLQPPTAYPQSVAGMGKRLRANRLGLDLVFYRGELPEVWPFGLLQELGYDPEHNSADLEERAQVYALEREITEGDGLSEYLPFISGGLPIERGKLQPGQQFSVRYEGQLLPTQSKPTGFWPDGSVKWLHITFPHPQNADAVIGQWPELIATDQIVIPFQLTYRNQEADTFSLVSVRHYAEPSAIAKLDGSSDSVEVNTGVLSAGFTDGKDWLSHLLLNGSSLLQEGRGVEAAVDFFRPAETWMSNHQYVVGEHLPALLRVESVAIEENGPLRAIVLLKGRTDGTVQADVHLRFELYRGLSTMRVLHTVEFIDHDVRRDFVREIALRIPLQAQSTVELEFDDTSLRLDQDDVAQKTVLLQESPYSYRVFEKDSIGIRKSLTAGERSQGWMQVSTPEITALVAGRGPWQEFPKSLEWDQKDGVLTVGLWPADAALMDVRRYSNFPHRAQGESVSGSNRWVEDQYYPNDPFAGVSRSHEVLLHFSSEKWTAADSLMLARDFQSRPLIYAGAEAYQNAEVALNITSLQDFPLFEKNNQNLLDFILFHKDHWNWYGFWHHGDVQHHFRSGYGWIVDADVLQRYLAMPESERRDVGRVREAYSDYRPQHDWASDNGRWGWTNTEGLPNLWLQSEYLKTGRRDLFFAAEALARHSRDVVMRHSGRWYGLGTRHGVQHWSDGNHEVRQTSQSETRLHYFLTGEPRTREFALQLAEEVYSVRRVTRGAAHSGHLYGLLFAWELTGTDEYAEMMHNYMKALSYPEGLAIDQTVVFPGPVRAGGPDGLNGFSMFFHTFGAMHAVLEYYNLTGDPVLKDSLINMAHAFAEEGNVRRLSTVSKVVGFGIQHSNDNQPLIEYAQRWLEEDQGGLLMVDVVSDHPRHWSGPSSYLRRNIPMAFFMANSMPYLLESLGTEPVLSEEIQRQVDDYNENGVSRNLTPLSWQLEFDRPELYDYLGRWQPWHSQRNQQD